MRYYIYKMKLGFMNILAFITTIFSIVLYYLIFNDYDISKLFIVYFFLWLFLHEIIHGIAFMLFKEVQPKNVTFGAKLESGIFYCMCKQSISKKVILTSLLAPLTIIGIITLIIAIIFNVKTLGFLSLLNISGSIGDIVMTFMFLRLPKDIQYTDLDDCEGFVVLSKDDLEKKKNLGINLVEYGDYTKDIVPKDFQRIKCSKFSLFIFIILILIVILDLIG